MIENKNTNIVYLSDLLKTNNRFKKTCSHLIQILDRHKINYDFLKSTSDIWCRDYMPIQIEKDKFIQFRYEPSYLKEEPHLQLNPEEVCKANKLNLNSQTSILMVEMLLIGTTEQLLAIGFLMKTWSIQTIQNLLTN